MRRGGAAAVAAPALLLAAVMAAILVYSLGRDRGDARVAGRARGDLLAGALYAQSPAAPPLAGFGEARIAVGGRCILVGVADARGERVRGLRGVDDLGRYGGMLFVFAQDGRGQFTMAGTTIALDVTFYDSRGTDVDRASMKPCPDGDDTSCPLYGSRGPYRFALEAPAGELGAGVLAPCA